MYEKNLGIQRGTLFLYSINLSPNNSSITFSSNFTIRAKIKQNIKNQNMKPKMEKAKNETPKKTRFIPKYIGLRVFAKIPEDIRV